MAINFPDSPSNGDTVTVGDKTWTWNGSTWDVVVSTPISNQIIDADGDTRVHVEESPDEDYLRFDTAGTERMTINPSGNVAMTGDLTVTGTIAAGSNTDVEASIDAVEADVSTLQTDVTNINELQQNEQTGTTYTLALTDSGKVVEMNNASANTLTVPPNSSVAFPVGSQILVLQTGAGQTTLAAGAGVTINSKDGNLKLSAQWCAATLIKRATDVWVVVGDLSA
jgi:hypothetical protein